MKTGGGVDAAQIAVARLRVARTRLSRIRALRSAVHRPPSIDSPVRLITALAPSSTDAHGPLLPLGTQPTLVTPGTPVPGSCRESPETSPRDNTRTSWPSSAYVSASGLPRNPVP